jgi:hypothetical protein
MLPHQTSVWLDIRATQEGEWACNELQSRQGSWSQGHRRVQCCQFDGHFFELLNELSNFAQCVE